MPITAGSTVRPIDLPFERASHSFDMNPTSEDNQTSPTPERKDSWSALVTVTTVLIIGATLVAILWYTLGNSNTPAKQTLPSAPKGGYPVGITSSSQPSGQAPPGANALAGYVLSYENDFTGKSLPTGWYVFTGIPGGDPGGQFGSAHVVVVGGLLELNAWKDPAYHNKWVTGGLCQCALAHTYGAFFVRSRITGPGPNNSELLWPAGKVWPPEIDFNENGGSATNTSSTVHFGKTNSIDQRSVNIDMTQWHTWGVIWTPALITYTVDGRVWGSVSVTSEIPSRPMTLDMEQRVRCPTGNQCLSAPESMNVDWVAAYTPK